MTCVFKSGLGIIDQVRSDPTVNCRPCVTKILYYFGPREKTFGTVLLLMKYWIFYVKIFFTNITFHFSFIIFT